MSAWVRGVTSGTMSMSIMLVMLDPIVRAWGYYVEARGMAPAADPGRQSLTPLPMAVILVPRGPWFPHVTLDET